MLTPGLVRVLTRSTSSLRPSPENDRLYKPVDPADPAIQELAVSIAQHGECLELAERGPVIAALVGCKALLEPSRDRQRRYDQQDSKCEGSEHRSAPLGLRGSPRRGHCLSLHQLGGSSDAKRNLIALIYVALTGYPEAMGKDRPQPQGPQTPAQVTQFGYERMHEVYLGAERLRGELGVFVLKVIMTVNAGALVGILALVANMDRFVNQRFYQAVLAVSWYYFGGLVAALLAGGLGYFYQAALALDRVEALNKAASLHVKDNMLPKVKDWLFWATVLTCLAAFALFVAGGLVFLMRVA